MRYAAEIRKAGAGIWLVALALFVRALIPSGYMVAPVAGDHLPQISICDRQTILAANGDATHGEHHAPDQPERRGDQHCAFAFHVGDAPPPKIGEPGSTLPIKIGTPLAQSDGGVILQALAAPPPPSTGPPTRA